MKSGQSSMGRQGRVRDGRAGQGSKASSSSIYNLKHTKIEEATRKYKTCYSADCIEAIANDRIIIMEKEKLLERWKEYTAELHKENRPSEHLVMKRKRENLPIRKTKL